jgi:Predicted membrane protein
LTNKSLGLNPRYFQSLDEAKFELSVDKFKNKSLRITSDLNHDTVRGSINVDEDSPLLLSIPYDDGWSASVDGKKVKIHKVVSNLMAIDLKKGQHTVILNYQVPGLKLGWFVSIIAVILFLSFLWIIKVKDRSQRKYS